MLRVSTAGLTQLVRTERVRALLTHLGEAWDTHYLPASPQDHTPEIVTFEAYTSEEPRAWRDALSSMIILHSEPGSRSLFSL